MTQMGDALDVVPLISFYASVRKHPIEAFVEKHPEPVLLFTPTVTNTSPTRQFATTQVTAAAELKRTQGTEAGRKGIEMRVAILRKSQRNPFTGQIYVGRAPNNDVVVDEPSVSKSHAFFERRENGWWVTDMGSANGTLVNGMRATAATFVRDGQKLQLGDLPVMFLSADMLHTHVSQLLQSAANE